MNNIKKQIQEFIDSGDYKTSPAFKEAVKEVLKETYGDDLVSIREFLDKNI